MLEDNKNGNEPKKEEKKTILPEDMSYEEFVAYMKGKKSKASSASKESEEAPMEEVPVEETPVEEAPVEQTPVEETPVEEAPVEEAPAEETPVEEASIEEAPAEEANDEEKAEEESPVRSNGTNYVNPEDFTNDTDKKEKSGQELKPRGHIKVRGSMDAKTGKLNINHEDNFNADLFDEVYNSIYGPYVHSGRKITKKTSEQSVSVFNISVNNLAIVVKLSYVDSVPETNWVEKIVYKELAEVKERNHTVRVPVLPKGTEPFEIPVDRFDEAGEKCVGHGFIRCLPMKLYNEPDFDFRDNIYGALKVIASILKDLSSFHRKGWIHRDIKPQNIVKKGNDYIIIDWESAVRKSDERLIGSQLVGTKPYIHPWRYILKDGKPANENLVENDLYSVGIFLLRMLSSDEEFNGLFCNQDGILKLEDEAVAKLIKSKTGDEALQNGVYNIIYKACLYDYDNGEYESKAYKNAGQMLTDVENPVNVKKKAWDGGAVDKKGMQTPIAFIIMAFISVITAVVCGFCGGCFEKGFDVVSVAIATVCTVAIFWLLSGLYEKILEKAYGENYEMRPCDRTSHPEWIICSLVTFLACAGAIVMSSMKYELSAISFSFYIIFSVSIMLLCLIFNILRLTEKLVPVFGSVWVFFAMTIYFSFNSYLTIGSSDIVFWAMCHNIILNIIISAIKTQYAVVAVLIIFLINPEAVMKIFGMKKGGR